MNDNVELEHLLKIAIKGQKDLLIEENSLKKEMTDFYNEILSTKFEVSDALNTVRENNINKIHNFKMIRIIRYLLIAIIMMIVPNIPLLIGLLIVNKIISSISIFKINYPEYILGNSLKKIKTQQDITYDELDLINSKIKSMKDKISEYEKILYYNFPLDDDIDFDMISPLEVEQKCLDNGIVKVLKI